MADNTFNFDLDAPAVPTLTLDPTPAEEEKAAPAQQEAAAPAQPQAIQAASIQFAPPISKVQPASRPPSIPPMPLEATIITVWPRTRSASGTDSLTK